MGVYMYTQNIGMYACMRQQDNKLPRQLQNNHKKHHTSNE